MGAAGVEGFPVAAFLEPDGVDGLAVVALGRAAAGLAPDLGRAAAFEGRGAGFRSDFPDRVGFAFFEEEVMTAGPTWPPYLLVGAKCFALERRRASPGRSNGDS
jgi:hypothetical protein